MDGHTHTQHLDTLTPNFLSKLILSSQNESKVKVANSLQGARGGAQIFFFITLTWSLELSGSLTMSFKQ